MGFERMDKEARRDRLLRGAMAALSVFGALLLGMTSDVLPWWGGFVGGFVLVAIAVMNTSGEDG